VRFFPCGASADRPAPKLELPAIDGTTIRLSDLRGKVVLRRLLGELVHPLQGVVPGAGWAPSRAPRSRFSKCWPSTSTNGGAMRTRFLAGRSPAMTVLFDPRERRRRPSTCARMPSSAVIDRAGNIRFTHEGYSSKTLDSYRREIATLLAE
jgi:hypothetical protein